MAIEGEAGGRVDWSRRRETAWAILAVGLPVGGYLAWKIQSTIGLGHPRLWELLQAEPVFDLAMLDFLLTSAWAYLVLLGRSRRGWQIWAATPVFFVAPSLGIALFLLLDRAGRGGGLADPGSISAR